MSDPLVEQIEWEVRRRLRLLQRLAPGLSVADAFIGDSPERTAEMLWDGDEARPLMAMRILEGLWPRPSRPPAWWWRTPIGWACAWHTDGVAPTWFGNDLTERAATELLGVSDNVFAMLVTRELVEQPLRGGPVSLPSVLRHLIKKQPEWADWTKVDETLSIEELERRMAAEAPDGPKRGERRCHRCGVIAKSTTTRRDREWFCPPCWDFMKSSAAAGAESV